MENKKIDHGLISVPETMLIPLWAKATEYSHPSPILRDSKAVEIMSRIDYDFGKFRGVTMSQVGCCVRASLIDEETRSFLALHPDAVVIQLGAGIDARYERLGRPACAHWYDLDLPEGIALRRQVLEESDANSYLAQSLFDYDWIDRVSAHGGPVLILIEGVLMYFEREEVRAFFVEMCERLGAATIVFDMLAYMAVGHGNQHDALRKMDQSGVAFRWSETETAVMESWHPRLHLSKEYYMSDHSGKRFPWFARLMYRIPYFYRRFNQRIVRLEIR